MGRPKSYDREEVTRKAMELLWQRGFHATSTKALAEKMGINVYSLFAEFESKQGLYEAALELYEREVVSGLFGALEGEDAGLEEIVAVLQIFASSAGSAGAEKGCLLCNSATERGAEDSFTHGAVGAWAERVQGALQHALVNAKARGEIRPEVSCEDQARLLTSTLLGFSVLLRAGVDREVIVGSTRAAFRTIEQMRV